MWKMRNSLEPIFFLWNQLFSKFSIPLVITLLSRNFCVNTCETQCGKTRNSLSLKKLSSNQLFSNFFSKTIAFTKFLRKKCEREFLQFPHCVKVNFRDFQTVEKYLRTYTCTTSKVSFSVKSIFSTLTSRNISNKSKCVTRFHEFYFIICTEFVSFQSNVITIEISKQLIITSKEDIDFKSW